MNVAADLAEIVSSPSRARPLPAEMSVAEGRDRYLDENGFTLSGYDAQWTEASFFGLNFKVPNTKRHRWAIMLHDLHHVATGYGTDLAGEAEISAWEVRRGLSGLGTYVGAIVLLGALAGVVLYPRRTLGAWNRAGGAVGNLFQDDTAYEELLALRIGELRRRLRVSRDGIAARPRALHPNAPASAACRG